MAVAAGQLTLDVAGPVATSNPSTCGGNLMGLSTLTRSATLSAQTVVAHMDAMLTAPGLPGPPGPPGPAGPAGSPAPTFMHTQATPAATWTLAHHLAAFPAVLVVAADGTQLLAEIRYPDDQTVVIVHGRPYAGSAYLRG